MEITGTLQSRSVPLRRKSAAPKGLQEILNRLAKLGLTNNPFCYYECFAEGLESDLDRRTLYLLQLSTYSIAGGSISNLRRSDESVVELKTAQSAATTGILHPGIFHTRDVTGVFLNVIETKKFEVGDIVSSGQASSHSDDEPPDKPVNSAVDSLLKVSSPDDLSLPNKSASYLESDQDVDLRDSLKFDCEAASAYCQINHHPAFDTHRHAWKMLDDFDADAMYRELSGMYFPVTLWTTTGDDDDDDDVSLLASIEEETEESISDELQGSGHCVESTAKRVGFKNAEPVAFETIALQVGYHDGRTQGGSILPITSPGVKSTRCGACPSETDHCRQKSKDTRTAENESADVLDVSSRGSIERSEALSENGSDASEYSRGGGQTRVNIDVERMMNSQETGDGAASFHSRTLRFPSRLNEASEDVEARSAGHQRPHTPALHRHRHRSPADSAALDRDVDDDVCEPVDSTNASAFTGCDVTDCDVTGAQRGGEINEFRCDGKWMVLNLIDDDECGRLIDEETEEKIVSARSQRSVPLHRTNSIENLSVASRPSERTTFGVDVNARESSSLLSYDRSQTPAESRPIEAESTPAVASGGSTCHKLSQDVVDRETLSCPVTFRKHPATSGFEYTDQERGQLMEYELNRNWASHEPTVSDALFAGSVADGPPDSVRQHALRQQHFFDFDRSNGSSEVDFSTIHDRHADFYARDDHTDPASFLPDHLVTSKLVEGAVSNRQAWSEYLYRAAGLGADDDGIELLPSVCVNERRERRSIAAEDGLMESDEVSTPVEQHEATIDNYSGEVSEPPEGRYLRRQSIATLEPLLIDFNDPSALSKVERTDSVTTELESVILKLQRIRISGSDECTWSEGRDAGLASADTAEVVIPRYLSASVGFEELSPQRGEYRDDVVARVSISSVDKISIRESGLLAKKRSVEDRANPCFGATDGQDDLPMESSGLIQDRIAGHVRDETEFGGETKQRYVHTKWELQSSCSRQNSYDVDDDVAPIIEEIFVLKEREAHSNESSFAPSDSRLNDETHPGGLNNYSPEETQQHCETEDKVEGKTTSPRGTLLLNHAVGLENDLLPSTRKESAANILDKPAEERETELVEDEEFQLVEMRDKSGDMSRSRVVAESETEVMGKQSCDRTLSTTKMASHLNSDSPTLIGRRRSDDDLPGDSDPEDAIAKTSDSFSEADYDLTTVETSTADSDVAKSVKRLDDMHRCCSLDDRSQRKVTDCLIMSSGSSGSRMGVAFVPELSSVAEDDSHEIEVDELIETTLVQSCEAVDAVDDHVEAAAGPLHHAARSTTNLLENADLFGGSENKLRFIAADEGDADLERHPVREDDVDVDQSEMTEPDGEEEATRAGVVERFFDAHSELTEWLDCIEVSDEIDAFPKTEQAVELEEPEQVIQYFESLERAENHSSEPMTMVEAQSLGLGQHRRTVFNSNKLDRCVSATLGVENTTSAIDLKIRSWSDANWRWKETVSRVEGDGVKGHSTVDNNVTTGRQFFLADTCEQDESFNPPGANLRFSTSGDVVALDVPAIAAPTDLQSNLEKMHESTFEVENEIDWNRHPGGNPSVDDVSSESSCSTLNGAVGGRVDPLMMSSTRYAAHPRLLIDDEFSVLRGVSGALRQSIVHDGLFNTNRTHADDTGLAAAVPDDVAMAPIPSGDPEDEGLGTDDEFF